MVDFKNSRLLVSIAGNGLENLEWIAVCRGRPEGAAKVALAASPCNLTAPGETVDRLD